MPADISADLNPAEILSIVGYLKTLGSTPDAQHLVELLPEAVSRQKAAKQEFDFFKAQLGKEVFFGKGQCSSCHQLRDLPGNTLVAPNLLRTGVHSEEYLRQSILAPNKDISPGYRLTRVVLTSGKTAVGRLISQTESEIELLGTDSNSTRLQKIPRAEIDAEEEDPMYLELPHSSMPTGYSQTISEEEIAALVHFLKTLPR